MKKILTVLMAGVILMCAGCGNAPADTAPTSAADTAPAVTEPAAGEDTEGEAPDVTEPDEALPEEDEGSEGSGSEAAETPAVKLTQAVVDCGVEMPMLMILEDEEYLRDSFMYDLSLADDYCVRVSMMSAQLYEFAVIKPVEGKEQEALDMLNARKDMLISTVAWYEDQKVNAEATIVGSYKGYVYLLCDKNSAVEEEALKKAIDELG